MSYRGSGIFTSLLAVLFIGLVAFAVAGYAMGWLSFKQSPEQTTIEINTHQIEDAAHKPSRKGQI